MTDRILTEEQPAHRPGAGPEVLAAAPPREHAGAQGAGHDPVDGSLRLDPDEDRKRLAQGKMGCAILALMAGTLLGCPLVVFFLPILWWVARDDKRMALAAANPRPCLVLDPAQPVLGRSLHLSWEISAGAERLLNLKIFITGEESVTYRCGVDGDNTGTDTARFYECVLVDTSAPESMARGCTDHLLPAGLAASWHAPNNRIVWSLRVIGATPVAPNIDDTYKITVLSAGS